MATLMNANLPSEDEEDQDYVPDEVDEEEKKAAAKKKPKRLRGAAAGAGVGGDDDEGQGTAPAGNELEDEDSTLPESKRQAKKAKVDALWSQLNAAKPKPAAKPGGGASLASLCKPAGSKGKGSADEVRAWDVQDHARAMPGPCQGRAWDAAAARGVMPLAPPP